MSTKNPDSKFPSSKSPNLDYQSVGVDIARGDELVDWLMHTDKSGIHRENIIGGIGGFASLFRFNFPKIKKPVLVSSTDGVGTKVKLAADHSRLEGIGQDLVAMCVNDLITTGATPLFFLDYYASSRLDLVPAKSFLSGLRVACEKAQVALVGGETAEMPGIYHGRDFDVAGFAVGVVDEDEILGPKRIGAGDIVIGISSSGFHSNGYSLLRKVFERDIDQWIDTLLTPTHLYSELTQKLKPWAKGFANITGGGVENLLRVIPENCHIQLFPWEWPEIFREVQKRTGMGHQQMLRTLNCGVGFTTYIHPSHEKSVMDECQKLGFYAHLIGEVSSNHIAPPRHPEAERTLTSQPEADKTPVSQLKWPAIWQENK